MADGSSQNEANRFGDNRMVEVKITASRRRYVFPFSLSCINKCPRNFYKCTWMEMYPVYYSNEKLYWP